MNRFLNLDDASHGPTINVPGLPLKYNKRTKMVMAIWTIIFASPFLVVLICVG